MGWDKQRFKTHYDKPAAGVFLDKVHGTKIFLYNQKANNKKEVEDYDTWKLVQLCEHNFSLMAGCETTLLFESHKDNKTIAFWGLL